MFAMAAAKAVAGIFVGLDMRTVYLQTKLPKRVLKSSVAFFNLVMFRRNSS